MALNNFTQPHKLDARASADFFKDGFKRLGGDHVAISRSVLAANSQNGVTQNAPGFSA